MADVRAPHGAQADAPNLLCHAREPSRIISSVDRLLLLVSTASYRAGAFLQAAEHLGVPVVVGCEQPHVLATANPAGNLTLDFQHPEHAVAAAVEYAARFPIQAVVAADDDGAVLGAMIARALGLRHNSVEAVRAARDKHRMRQALAAAGIPTPRFECFAISTDPREAARGVSYPCVVKPLALAASRGVMRADDTEQFAVAFERLVALLRRPEGGAQGPQLADHVLVESYIPGIEVALEGLLDGGRLKVLAIFDKPDPLEGPFFEETIYVTPSRLDAPSQQAIADCAARVTRALGLGEGPVHAELRVNAEGVWMIEIAPRSIGGLCSRALRFGDGVSLEELILRLAMGLEVEGYEREPAASGVMMIPIPRGGVLDEVRGQEEAGKVGGIEEIRITLPKGAEVVPLPEGARYLGFIFARGETPERVVQALREAHGWLEVVIRSPAHSKAAQG